MQNDRAKTNKPSKKNGEYKQEYKMSEETTLKGLNTTTEVEHVKEFLSGDLNDLCDATDAAITNGAGNF